MKYVVGIFAFVSFLAFNLLIAALMMTVRDAFVAIVFLAISLVLAVLVVGAGFWRHVGRFSSIERSFYQAVLSSNALFFVRQSKDGYDVTAYIGGNRVVTFRVENVRRDRNLILFCGTFLAAPASHVQFIPPPSYAQNGAKANRPKK
jgi:hypothetical protein